MEAVMAMMKILGSLMLMLGVVLGGAMMWMWISLGRGGRR